MSDPQPASRQVTIQEAMGIALQHWQQGRPDDAATLCRAILGARPGHQGARHLLMTLEHNVQALPFTALALHDSERYDIGDFSYGAPRVFPHNQPHEPAWLVVGRYCTLAHDIEIILGSYHRKDWFTIYPFSAPNMGTLFALPQPIPDFSATRGDVVIGSDVWIGARSIVLSGVSIGHGAVVGAGSVVSRDIGPYEIWAGNPAVFVRHRFELDVRQRLQRLRWWDWPAAKVVEHSARISSADPGNLDVLEAQAQQVWPQQAVDGTGFVDVWLRTERHRVRVRRPVAFASQLPTLLVLHGSFGSIESVFSLAQHLAGEFNLVFCDLPGFGHSAPPVRLGMASFAEAMAEVLEQLGVESYFVCGASFGGAVALSLAGSRPGCAGVVLLDTPMTALKLWHNHQFLRQVMQAQPDSGFARRFAFHIYGVTAGTAVERSYFNLVDQVAAPVLAVVGDEPMMPPRASVRVPACLDADDLSALARRPHVRTAVIAGGHDLVGDNAAGVATLLRAFAAHPHPSRTGESA